MPETRAMLLDIEGTTTAVAFVYEVLFPYARKHLEEFLRSHAGEDSLEADLARLRVEQAGDPEQSSETAAEYLIWLMDQDRKSTALKSIQGKIWEEGYRRGLLRGSVYEDVPRAFDRWSRMDRRIAIFSSGSVLAQKLLFGNTAEGDLTGYLDGYFDTTIGPKKEAESYARIARSLGLPASDVLFVSDVVAELEAAQAAGMATALCVRLPSVEQPQWSRTIQTFDEL
jgi:enolase-phosphatase E1